MSAVLPSIRIFAAQPSRQPTPIAQMIYATFWRRLAAITVDFVVFLPALFALTLIESYSKAAAVALARSDRSPR